MKDPDRQPTVRPTDPGMLSPEAVGTLRHDLRTLVTHVLGYSEMLLEEIEEDSPPGLADGLNRVHAVGQELLTLVNEGLAPSRGSLPRGDLAALTNQLTNPLEQLQGESEALLRLGRQPGLEGLHRELGKIHSAVVEMFRFLATRLSGAEEGPPEPKEATASGRPLAHPPVAPPAGQPEPKVAEGTAAHLGRILVVDDNETNCDILGRRLEKQGYAVETACNGARALELLRSGSFDLVLLDILMPEVDGYEVLEQVKGDPVLRDLPVIMISALDEIQSVVRCIERGAEDYLPKPFDPVLLRARVGACLEKKRLRDKELDYLRNVAAVTDAAGSVEAGTFDPLSLEAVAQRPDALGRLAAVFQRMAREVALREQRLQQQVQKLRIEIDETRKARQVAEITGTDYFQELHQKANSLRRRMGQGGG